MDPFVAAICAKPDDDLPRMIYADWLEERGDPRGEFIRLQMADHLGEPGDRVRAESLRRRYGRKWSGPLTDWGYDITWRRGFPEHLIIPAEVFIDFAHVIFDIAPIRGVTLIGAAERIRELVRQPELARLSALHLTGGLISDGGVAKIAGCPHLANLRTLRLGACGLTGGALVDIADSPHLANLVQLDMPDNAIDSLGAKYLVHAVNLKHLERLDIRRNELTLRDIAILRSSPALPRLKHIEAGGQRTVEKPQTAWAVAS